MKKPKTVPKFKSIEEMADFWDTHSTADYPDFWEPVINFEGVVALRVDQKTADAVQKMARQKKMNVSDTVRMLIRERLSQLKAI